MNFRFFSKESIANAECTFVVGMIVGYLVTLLDSRFRSIVIFALAKA